jgi:hypothetical protein
MPGKPAKPKIKRTQKTLYFSVDAIEVIRELAFYYDKPQSQVLEELIMNTGLKVLKTQRAKTAAYVLSEMDNGQDSGAA